MNDFFTDKEKIIGRKMFKKINDIVINDHQWLLAEHKDLGKIFKKEEIRILDKIIYLDSFLKFSEFGISKERFVYDFSVPENILIAIKKQVYFVDGKEKFVKTQYLTFNVAEAFIEMKAKMDFEISRRLNIVSGYRSPIYQAIVFFYNLHLNNWDINYTLKRVALPGYSEHGYLERLGVDFAPVESIPKLKDFDKTKEYKWLRKNAGNFGFHLSYPKNNKQGFIFEPWHWHFH